MSFILYRHGKNAIGPFASFENAVHRIAEDRLIGYAVIPMQHPEKDRPQEVVASGLSRIEADDILADTLDTYKWQESDGTFISAVIHNSREFLKECSRRSPGVGKYKIQVIKNIRELCHNNGYVLGLKEAKDLVDDFFGRNTTGEST